MPDSKLDLLLAWLSERSSGRWELLKQAYNWLLPVGTREDWQTASFTARMLSTLGHIEIDWGASRWAAAPPVLTLLPNAGAHALLTGGRTRALRKAFDTLVAQEDLKLGFVPPIPQKTAPSAILVEVEDERSARRLAEELGINFTYSVSEALSKALPSLDSLLLQTESHPPARGYGIQKFEESSLTWRDAEADTMSGLYRYDTRPREFRLHDNDGRIFAPDEAIGVWAALSRWGENKLKWDRRSVNGELIVPFRTPLPTLQARAAALCTGLSPEKRNDVLVYRNVPNSIAKRIAQSLDQSLIEMDFLEAGGSSRGSSRDPRPSL